MASPEKKSFLLRIDPTLWNGLERLAAGELRSVNAQIEYLLREALVRRGIGDDGAARRASSSQADPSASSRAASKPASKRRS